MRVECSSMVYQSNSLDAPVQSKSAIRQAVKHMPSWKWKLLGFSLVTGCIGVGGEAASYFLKHPQPAPVVTQSTPVSPGSINLPSGSSGFVGSQPADGNTYPQSPPVPPAAPAASPASPDAPTMTDLITPFMSHFGFSLFVGVIVGLIFRTFVRMTILFTALVALVGVAFAHFHINIDLTSVKNESAQATSWLTDQGYRIKDMLFHALPSSTAAGIGFLFGFKKK